MRGGDLSNRMSPRWVFVYEGLVADVPLKRAGVFRAYRAARLHDRAVAQFVTEPHVSKVVQDLYWRQDYRFDVVTFLPDLRDAIEKRLDHEAMPFSNVLAYEDHVELNRALVYMPDVVRVVHHEGEHVFAYGPKGLYVSDPASMSTMGA